MKKNDFTFQDAVAGFLAGDFSRLAHLFANDAHSPRCTIIEWYEQGFNRRHYPKL